MFKSKCLSVWNGKPDKIKREILYCSKEDGSLKVINISKFIDALKITWVKRFLENENKACWKILFSNELFQIGGDWIWLCKSKCHTDFRYEKNNNGFLCDVIN